MRNRLWTIKPTRRTADAQTLILGSLTDFGGGHRDVVPHVGLSVQRLGQRYLPVVHVDVELPLQVRVPIDEVSAKTTRREKFEPNSRVTAAAEAFSAPAPWVLRPAVPYPSRAT